jgi:sugar phosphate isomerase/epimerase
MPSRRTVVQGFAGAVVLGFSPLATPRKLDRIGLQLYTVRTKLREDFEGTLARVAAIGYSEVEFAGYFNREPAEIKVILARYGLSAPAAHLKSTTASGFEQALEAAAIVGHQYIIRAYIAADERRTPSDYKRIAAELNRAGETAKKSGLQFAYHNHDFEFATLEGQIPYDVLLAETDPALVQLELDLYWIAKGNQDPVKYFDRYPRRFVSLHVKDMDATPQRGQTEVGHGILDFKRIFAQAGRAGVKHFFVEHDQPAEPFDSIQSSYDYLKRLEF